MHATLPTLMRPTSIASALRVMVPVKRTIDYAVKIRVASDGKGVDTNVKHAMNPFDEIAVEEAVRLREKHKGAISKIVSGRAAGGRAGAAASYHQCPEGRLLTLTTTSSSRFARIQTAVSAGPAKTADVLRTALAMGADDAIHVEIPDNSLGGPLEPLGVSKILREVIKKANEEEEVGLVIMGKQAIDDDASQTGQMLAAQLGWPQATFASKLEFTSGKLEKGEEVQVTREVDGGLAVVKTKLPFVMTTDLRLNEPRYASLPNIMKAKKKPFKKYSLKDLGLEEEAKPRLETLKVAEPPKREGGAKVEDVDALISKLKELGRID